MENGYLIQEHSNHDKRMTRVRLAEKGLDLTAKIDDLYERNAEEIIKGLASLDQMKELNRILTGIERYWSRLVSFGR